MLNQTLLDSFEVDRRSETGVICFGNLSLLPDVLAVKHPASLRYAMLSRQCRSKDDKPAPASANAGVTGPPTTAKQ